MSSRRPPSPHRRECATPGQTNAADGPWQRERLFAAIADEVSEHGYAGTSVAGIAARAGLSPAEFRLHFSDKEDCFLAAFESLVQQLVAHTLAAYRNSRRDWRGSIGTALTVLVRAMGTRPSAVRAYMVLIDVGSVSARARASRDHAVGLFGDVLFEMVHESPGTATLPPATVRGMVGGIWRLIENRMREDRAADLPAAIDGVVDWVLSYVDDAERPHALRPTTTAEGRELTLELTYGTALEMLRRGAPQPRPEEIAFAALAPIVGLDKASRLRSKGCSD